MSRRFILMTLGIAILLSTLPSEIVHAATNDSPDSNDFTNSTRYGDSYPLPTWGREVQYTVATSAYNTILQSVLNVYMPSSSGQITIYNPNICYGTFRAGGRNYDQIDDGTANSSGNAVSFTINGSTQWGAWDGSGTCDSKNLVFNVSGAGLDPNTGMYKYTLVVSANPSTDKYMDTFRVIGPANAIVSQDSSQPSSAFALNLAAPIPAGSNPSNTQSPPSPYVDYWNGVIKFAPDCSVNTPTVSRRIEIFDDDNHGNWDVQPRPFLAKLREYNRSGVFQGEITPTVSLPDGGGTWSVDGSGYYDLYGGGNNKRIWLDYTLKRDMIYQWWVDSVYYDNTLQFKIPFDTIYYYKQCQIAESTLKAGMTASPATMGQDESTTFTPSITAANFRVNQTVNCGINRTFYSPGTYPGGGSSLGAQPCTDTGGNANITVSGNGVINLKTNAYSSPGTALPGSRICDTITITNPSASKYFVSAGDNTATFCVTIAKTPYVRFMGGDVFAGGDFSALDATCSNQAKITTTARQLSDSSIAGSVTEYHAFALDKITAFGSAGKGLIASGSVGGSNRALTFANSEPDATLLGYYGTAQHCITDYIPLYSSAPTLAAGTYNVGTRGVSGAWHVTGTLNLSGTMPAGDVAGGQQVYYADGDVTISGDLKYPATYASPNAIPSLIIVTKGNIYIQSGVKQMDGIFEARGDGATTGIVYTCWPRTEPAVVNNACDTNQLVVNGAATAARFDLFRTNGASGATPVNRKQPAELFQYAPEMFLNSALNNNGGSQMTVETSTVLDLPPRF